MVFQSDASLFYHLTVQDNIRFPFKHGNKGPLTRDIANRIGDMLDRVELQQYRTASVSKLSAGMRQRVALARSLIYRPTLLLLDEPFVGLDNNRRDRMLEMILSLNRDFQSTLLFVTHDDREAKKLATHIMVLRDSQILQYDTAPRVFAAPADAAVATLLNVTSPQTAPSP